MRKNSLIACAVVVGTLATVFLNFGTTLVSQSVHSPTAITGTQSASPQDQKLAWATLEQLASDVDADQIGSVGNISWHSYCQIFPDMPRCDTGANKMLETQFEPVHHLTSSLKGSAQNGDSVFYNRKATKFIDSCKSVDKRGNYTLRCLNSKIEFPVGSVIGRFGWNAIDQEACTTISVQASNGAIEWIRVDPKHYCTGPGFQIVPITKFFYVSSDGRAPHAMANGYGSALAPHKFALVVGFNLMNKVVPGGDWVWSTFWWTLDPLHPGNSGFSCPNRCPAASPGTMHKFDWSNYVMKVVSTSASNQPFVEVANPYLDSNGGMKTNCVLCHSYAMNPKNRSAGSQRATSCGAQRAEDLTPDTLKVLTERYAHSCSTTNPRISTDMLWTLPTLSPVCGNDACTMP